MSTADTRDQPGGESRAFVRAMPIGAAPQPDGGVHFRVWAPLPRAIVLTIDGTEIAVARDAMGYADAFVADAKPGTRYGYRLESEPTVIPDPASCWQPDGPHGLSCVADAEAFRWSDADWRGLSLDGQIVCEMHIGTFTAEGTWRAAAGKLPLLRDAGITLIEMMPVAEFSGRFGWGYDGVDLFAPTHLYGTPDDLRAFIDEAHRLGLGVIQDVVYNHFGPDGNYLSRFSDTYVSTAYDNEWGDAVNFDGPGSTPVREFVCQNAAFWIRDFHFDGLRIDATQQMFDGSAEHIVAELTRAARAAAGSRRIVVIAENEPQDARLVRPPGARGYGLDGLWNDDFHHATHVALTGRKEAYYSDYTGRAPELLACAKYGFLYQGQRSSWQDKPRGSASLDLDRSCRINFLENHDQVANSGAGQRLIELTDRARLRAFAALMILIPGTPMLFQGQEFASSAPFLYFADHKPELARAVAEGRREFLLQFPSLERFPLRAPHEDETFSACKIDWSERERNDWALRLHRDLIRLKRGDAVLRRQGRDGLDGAVLDDFAFLLRFFEAEGRDRLLIFNFGIDVTPRIFPEPLLAPPQGRSWRLLWSSEDPAYGGAGLREPLSEGRWFFPGQAALALTADEQR